MILMSALSCIPPPHKTTGFSLYVQVDINRRIPTPQVTGQDKSSVHDDQVGHDCVLHCSFLVRLDPLPNKATIFFVAIDVYY